MSSRPESRLEGALLGLALGDALGFVVEAEAPEVARGYVKDVLRAGRAGDRRHPRFPFGQYSDDTQLARELLLSIAADGRWTPAGFAARLAALVHAGRDIGAGPGTRSAAHRLLLGAPWTHAGQPAPYAGNGGAMRVAPVGVLEPWSVERRLDCAVEQCRVTHRDPRCAGGAVAVTGATLLAARSGPLDARESLEQIACWCEPGAPTMAALVREVATWLPLAPSAALARLHASGLDGDPAGPWRGISAYVLPSVAWSLYAVFRSPDDWWEAVCTAIEPGGDTDTMASIAGAIAGARLGPAALPAAPLARLTDQGAWDAEALAGVARRCAEAVAAAARPSLDSGGAGVIVAQHTLA